MVVPVSSGVVVLVFVEESSSGSVRWLFECAVALVSPFPLEKRNHP
ncbi:hypothetical protein B005_4833 [Nocardiopsis alba ATCC BAA-2165]|uniref:Uncharacterized protein n=1 Tax=Nocardiopsis alba (strain ATCC BAA-2165 / BE74) TaxID=1205910 RepID=J7L381_NOCAA|nr:hypothetical protein B005_4833 [Nocardiopsis alba ATCC BAA-2165]